MLKMLNLLCIGCFAARQHVDGCISFMRCNIYNWIVNMCIVRTCNSIAMPTFHFRKGVTAFSFSCYYLIYLLACDTNNWLFNPACRTASVKDTYQTQTAILFKVELNNFSKIFATLSACEKDFTEFPFLHIFNSMYTCEWDWCSG